MAHADDEARVRGDAEDEEEHPQHRHVVPEGAGVDADELEHQVAALVLQDGRLGTPTTQSKGGVRPSALATFNSLLQIDEFK